MQTRITAEELLDNPEIARGVASYLRYEAPDHWHGGHDGFLEKMTGFDIADRITPKRAEYLAGLSNDTLKYEQLGGYSVQALVQQCLEICAGDNEETEKLIREIEKREPSFVYGYEARKLLSYCRRNHIIDEEFIPLA